MGIIKDVGNGFKPFRLFVLRQRRTPFDKLRGLYEEIASSLRSSQSQRNSELCTLKFVLSFLLPASLIPLDAC